MRSHFSLKGEEFKITNSIGKLALSHAPGKQIKRGRDGRCHSRDLKKDVAYFKENGISRIVCLLNDPELRTIGVTRKNYDAACEQSDVLL